MAGTNSGFDAKAFRDGIRFAFDMAAPVAAGDRATFYFADVTTYSSPAVAGVPLDPSATVTHAASKAPVQVSCGVSARDAAGQEVAFGDVVAARLQVTLLDEDYAKVQGCAYMTLGGKKYSWEHTGAPQALFDVGLYTMRFESENQS